MNYLKIYQNLMKKGQIDKEKGREQYHFIPKSIFGDLNVQKTLNDGTIKSVESKTNWRYLLFKEHYIAHLLLLKIFKNNKNAYKKMLYAFNIMSSRGTSKKYSIYKEEFRKMMIEELSGKPSRSKGCKWSAEARTLRSNDRKGKSYEEMYGKERSDEIKKMRSISLKKNWKNKKYRNNMIKKLKIIERTSEWRKKLSMSRKGKLLSDKTKQKISNFMKNDRLNPNVNQTIFEFKHIRTGEIIRARKIDMEKKYKCTTIYRVIKGISHSSNGWFLNNK